MSSTQAIDFCLAISHVHARLSLKLGEELGRFHGLGLQDFMLLRQLARAENAGVETGALAEALNLPLLALTRLLLSLEKTGFVQREAAASGGASRRVVLRPAGRRVFNEALASAEEVCAPVLASVPSEAVSSVGSALLELGRTPALAL